MKVVVLLVLAAFSYGIWFWKRRVGARQLSEAESGQRCLSCHGDQLSVEAQHVRCQLCGHVTDLAWLNTASVDPQQMAEMSRPDRIR